MPDSTIAHMEEGPPDAAICEGYVFDSFEASLKLGTILHKGERLKIQRFPFKMLVTLLRKHGELVTKEELAKELWDQQPAGDTDQSLYVTVRKLRHLLGDDANEPRYIQTVSGRGYAFIGTVTPVFSPSPALSLPDPPQRTEQRGDVGSVLAVIAGRRTRRTAVPRTLWAWFAVAAALCAAAGVCLSIYRYEHRPLLNEQDKVAIGSFSNRTGNPNLDQTLSATIQSQLQESPYLNLIPDRRFRTLVRDSESASLQDELHACAKLDAQVLVKGRISAAPPGYEVALTAWRCSTGELLTTQKAGAASDAEVLPALDTAVSRMRRRLGESEWSLKRFNVPATQATTGSLAALKAFNFATEKSLARDEVAAVSGYKLATDIDPEFALAFARLGMSYFNMGQFALATQSFERAFQLRSNRASDRERLYILSHYYQFATGQIQRGIEVDELWRSLYPRDTVPMHNLAAKYVEMGRPEPALPLIEEAVQQEPNDLHFSLLVLVETSLGRYTDVLELCQDPLHGKTNSVGFHRSCFEAAFASNDQVAMRRELQLLQGTPEECLLIGDSAWAAMYHGKIAASRLLFQKAEQAAMRSNVVDMAADIGLDEAMLEAEAGSVPKARADVERVLKLPFKGASQQAYAARVLARSGENAKALLTAKKAETMAPLDDLVNSGMLPIVRALVELQKANPGGALDDLQSRQFDFCCKLPVADYYRGLAHLELKRPDLSARDFQAVIDHRSLSASFSIYLILSELELGHIYKLLGEPEKAHAMLANVALAWKDADPDFPPLRKLRLYNAALR